VRELAVVGAIAVAFALGSYYATRGPTGGELGWYGWANLLAGSAALLVAGVLAVRRAQGFGSPAARRVLWPRLLVLVGVLAGAVALERAAARTGWRLDWTADQRFELSPATHAACDALDAPLRATLFREPGDPRGRRSRFLLDGFAAARCLDVRQRDMEEAGPELEMFGVTTSDSVVLEHGSYYELVERPTEGALLEALLRLTKSPERRLYVTIGGGEGDLTASDDAGYSGLREALATEGYVLESLVMLAVREIPDDADGVLVVAPQRPLPPEALETLQAYVEGGGRLVVLLEPGADNGLEPLLKAFGFVSPPGMVVDAQFADLEGTARGTGVLVSTYSDHPITAGLESRHMSFYPGIRPVDPARKPRRDDRLEAVVYSSPRAWVTDRVEAARRGAVPVHRGEPLRRHPLVATGRYPREGGEARVVVFGDAGFASNRYLRALYNLDLVMNAVHWATEREIDITRRPKVLTPYQTPLPPQSTLQMLYGVGLLVPELLLMAGAVLWLRRRSG